MPQRVEPTYRAAFIAAWHGVLRHPVLWIVGVLATVLGECGFISFVGRLWYVLSNGITLADFWWAPRSFIAMFDVNVPSAMGSFTLTTLMIGLFLLVVVASCCAQGAIVSTALTLFRTKKMPTLAMSWHRGARALKTIIIARFFEHIILFALLVVTTLVVAILPHDLLLWQMMRSVIVASALLLGMGVSTVTIFTIMYGVDSNMPWHAALRAAMTLFSQHVIVSLEISCLVMLSVFGVVIAVVVAAYGALALGAFMTLMGIAGDDTTIMLFGVMFSSFIFVIAVALISGMFNVFVMHVWAYCFTRMQRNVLHSRLVRIQERIAGSVI